MALNVTANVTFCRAPLLSRVRDGNPEHKRLLKLIQMVLTGHAEVECRVASATVVLPASPVEQLEARSRLQSVMIQGAFTRGALR